MNNVLTIDVEDWFHLNYDSMDGHRRGGFEPRVEQNTEVLLSMLEAHGAKATLFFLGSVAHEYPQLVRRARDAGHEIASHGYAHELVRSQSREEFRTDVRRSLDALGAACDTEVRGYRAPSWSISKDTPWFHDVLAELGFEYSSSLFPFTTYLYGDSHAPTSWFAQHTTAGSIVEAPATVAEVGPIRVPFAGGVYLRALPGWAIRWATRRVNRRGRAAIFYLHPREIDPGQPRLPLPFVDRMVTYWGLRSTARKLHKLLATTTTITLHDHLREAGALR